MFFSSPATIAVIAVGIASIPYGVHANTCNTTVIAGALGEADVSACSTSSGYLFTTLTEPSDSQIALMCDDEACISALEVFEALDLGNCTIGTVDYMSEVVEPIKKGCNIATASSDSAASSSTSTVGFASSSGSTSSSGSASSSKTAAPSATAAPSGTSSPTDSASTSGSNEVPLSSSSSAKIGVIVGGTALAVIFIAIAVCYCRKKQSTISSKAQENDTSDPQVAVPKQTTSGGANDTESSHFTPLRSPTNDENSQVSKLWEDPIIVSSRIPMSSIELKGCISQGGYGEVYRALYRNRIVAVKMLLFANRKDMVQINAFLSEIRLAATLDHPNIVTFIGVAWESLSELCSVAEFMEGGDLRTLLTGYKQSSHPTGLDATKLRIAMQVAHALTYLHSLSPVVLHRDLKSRNILLSAQLEAKLTDFGASKERLDKTLTAGVGTLLWMAPEVLMGERYDEKADIFSFGVVLSELDTHDLPYESARYRASDGGLLPDVSVMQLVLLGRLRVVLSAGLQPSVRELAKACVSIDPRLRPTAAQATYELSKSLKG